MKGKTFLKKDTISGGLVLVEDRTHHGGAFDFASLYPSQIPSDVKIDLVKINREITISNIVNDTDKPLVRTITEALLHDMLMERIDE